MTEKIKKMQTKKAPREVTKDCSITKCIFIEEVSENLIQKLEASVTMVDGQLKVNVFRENPLKAFACICSSAGQKRHKMLVFNSSQVTGFAIGAETDTFKRLVDAEKGVSLGKAPQLWVKNKPSADFDEIDNYFGHPRP